MRVSIATAYLPPEELVPIAKAADEAGYHAMALADHVLNLEELTTEYPYTADGNRRWDPFTPWVDPMVAIGALGAVTERLRFFTNIYVLPMRNPFPVAKAVATASAFTGGRVSLGVGMGWCEEEFELLEAAFRKRGARADEMIEVLRALWTGEWVEHHGEFYDFPRLEMTPAPVGEVPIYVGGLSDAALRRAARNDGWISDLISTEQAAEFRTTIDGHRQALGATGDFSMIVSLNDAVTLDQFRRAEEVGVTDLLTMPWAYHGGFEQSLEGKIDGLKRFWDEVAGPLAG
ncbi:TIGR03619 family F420-dependent LLM class oxidoreductase [Aquihabitans daechungensis]|uniref:TIGR03619 family F420-dependent LLM class oxidoreductase n=1 Tax=Aquihabitans daechungensis TaxID=1052257 RepID=UPI003B9DDF9F